MSQGNGAAARSLTEESFRASFGSLEKAILAEWPVVDSASLHATAGEFDKVVELVAHATEHTQALVKKQLAELSDLDRREKSPSPAQLAVDMIERINKRTAELVKELRDKHLETAREKARENIFVTIFAALGIGLLIGFIFGGFRRGRR
jgi:hypothetical protein